ncbi:MAG: tetratricopeptide repeat protein, partial [bacterium]
MIHKQIWILLLFSGLSIEGLAQVFTSRIDSLSLTGFYFREGNDQVIHRDFDQAVRSYHTALDYTSQPDQQSRIHQNLGCVYYLRGEYEKATTHFTYAVHLLRTSGDLSESRLAGLSLNIGSA